MSPLFDALLPALADVPVVAWLAVGAVVLLQRLSAGLGLWAYALIALPGTLAHELAHYLVAQVLLARPRLPHLWPERTAEGWRLGSVAFVAPWWRAMPIALAPLLLAPGALAWLLHFLVPARGLALALHAWVVGTMLGASLPSRADWRIAAPGLLATGIVGICAYGAWRSLH